MTFFVYRPMFVTAEEIKEPLINDQAEFLWNSSTIRFGYTISWKKACNRIAS